MSIYAHLYTPDKICIAAAIVAKGNCNGISCTHCAINPSNHWKHICTYGVPINISHLQVFLGECPPDILLEVIL